MVRETRHLWIGNLPENVREEEIRDLFQRHGRVQSVKLLEEVSNSSNSGKSATVAFIDIRSASKALRSVRTVAGQPIHISYYEPGSTPLPPPSLLQNNQGETSLIPSEILIASSQGNSTNAATNNNPVVNNNCIPNNPGTGMYRQRFSSQHGQSEDTSSHFYDQPKSFSRGRGDGHGFRARGRRENRPPFQNRHSFPENRNYRSWNYHHEGRYAPPVHSEVDERPAASPIVTHTPPSESSAKGPRRPESPASSVSSRHLISKRRRSRSVSDSGSSGGSSVGSGSRSGSHSSVSTSVSSSRSRSPSLHGRFPRGGGSSTGRFRTSSHSRHRYSRSRELTRPSDSRIRNSSRSPLAASPSSSTSSSPSPHRKITAPHSASHSPSSSKSYSPSRNAGGSQHHNHHHHRRAPSSAELHAAIKIKNLPIRSSDTSLKDGLYHEYKKHGKVAWVRVNGNGQDRFAIVCFKSAEHATRAVSLSQGKLFFGCKIQVTPYNHTKGEEILGSQEEENKLLVDDEPTSVGYPTRTVLITGLDATVTPAELQSAFDQYGDIVRVDLKKQGTATHAICEFVDIASAIRAQWGRHVFKSKEARISFFRNPPTNSLLLDGTSGVTDKQVYGQCCQYGAIKEIVMDPERFLALVEFQEISDAQTAIRQLRSWVIKGKRLQVDFASIEVINRYLQRVSTGVSPTGSFSPGIISSPSIGNSITPLNESIDKKNEEVNQIYSILDDNTDSYRNSTTKVTPEIGSMDSANKEPYSVRTYTSPVSPDHSVSENIVQNSIVKCSRTIKIDLNCHETDSAVVTSSSDVVVGEKSEVHSNSGMTCDDKLGCLESREPRRSLDSSHSALIFVDGVSSTSPEPKTETVRKASPDSAIGSLLEARSSGESCSFAKGVSDPRRQLKFKIRRSSADSDNNTGSAIPRMHSTTSTTTEHTAADENESDERPGTPLFDENPESFAVSEAGLHPPTRHSSFTLNTKIDPISLPLPEFALHSHRHRKNSSTSNKEFPSSSMRLSRSSIDSEIKSPIKSPSFANSTSISSPMELEDSIASIEQSPTSNSAWRNPSPDKQSGESVMRRNSQSNCSSPKKDTAITPPGDIYVQQRETIGSPDSDSLLSPKSSPSSVSLEQRILKCCETYDRFSGSKPPPEIPCHLENIEEASHFPRPLKSVSSIESAMESPSSSRFKFLDWNELMQRPSDIGRSVLARKSVFDEDSKRLENFGEKYEGKCPSTPTSGKNWRAIALQRSISVSSATGSTSSASSWLPTTPSSPAIPTATAAPNFSLSARPSSVSSVSMISNFSPKSSAAALLHSNCAQLKPKDLNFSPLSSPKITKLEMAPKNHAPFGAQTPSMLNALQNKLNLQRTNSDTPNSPSGKTFDTKHHSTDSSSVCSQSQVSSRTEPTAVNLNSGIPRPVERSASLDSRKITSSACSLYPASQIKTPPHQMLSSSNDSINDSKYLSRRSSVDSQSLASQNKHPTTTGHPHISSSHAQIPIKMEIESISPSSSVSNSTISTTTGRSMLSKDAIVPKSELELIKHDISVIRPVQQQEATVAVVALASEQISFIPTRTDSVGSSSSKDSSRKDKEKKKSSGTSTPATSLPPSNFLNAIRSEPTVVAHSSSSQRDNIQPSVKKSEERKEKKDKDTSNVESGEKEDVARKSSSDKDKKDVKKEKRESHKDRDNVETPLSESHHQQIHRREKDSSSKRKRHSSGNETGDRDPDQKKPKVEKDPSEPLHNRLKTSTNERRESRDSSSSTNKEKIKEKEGNSRTSSFSLPESKDKLKEESSKSKENHHRSSKDKSCSSKDKHHGEKSRTSSESRSSLTIKSEQSVKDKDRSKKDRSPGKENLKGSTKHHSHGHSSSGHRSSTSSSSKPKEATTANVINKSFSHGPENSKRSQPEKHNSSSDSCDESHHSKGENSSEQTRSQSGKSHSRSSRSEKRTSEEKKERRQSGDATAGSDGERKKNREHKKKKRFVVEETESSDSDDEEKKKHHSIFEVVIDEYVSMYDKVKARSNRACKAQPKEPVEEVKKQDKIKDQLRQLKQCRAKKIEKKRSTSVDESNKSGVHTSSDEDDQSNILEKFHKVERTEEHHSFTQSSEDEPDDLHERIRAKSIIKKQKEKKMLLESQFKHHRRGKKSNKSPQRTQPQRSTESNSECESNASSSHTQQPHRKKKRLSSTKLPSTESAESTRSQRYKSSEDSLSDSNASVISKQEIHKLERRESKSKLQAADVYSDSDSSVQSGPVNSSQNPLGKILPGAKIKSKDKLCKQKNMKKSLFESSDSSDNESKKASFYDPHRKEKKETSASRTNDKENKIRRKHRAHTSSSKSGKLKKQRIGSGGSIESGSHSIGKRESSSSTMKDILFGPMSASSGSENEVRRSSDNDRPKTPTITLESPKKITEHHSQRKSKPLVTEDKKSFRSISPCSSSLEITSDATTEVEKSAPKPVSSSSHLEKKRKRHHKEKKLKKMEAEESHRSSKSIDLKPDFDSLFNSPRVSPCKEYVRQESLSPRLIKLEPILTTEPTHSVETNRPMSSPIKNNFEVGSRRGDTNKSMFSSESDDDDDKLKIGQSINEAIMASSDEPGLNSSDSGITIEKRKREEEEKQMNSLFEQDKAIESIVLLDRKSPPVAFPVVQEEDAIKDDIPKDCTAISQEETEDAVAALLVTLEGDDDMEEVIPVKPTQTIITPSVPSPPTLRIIEDSPSIVFEMTPPSTTKAEKSPSWKYEVEAKPTLLESPPQEAKYEKPHHLSVVVVAETITSQADSNVAIEDKPVEIVMPLRRISSGSTKSRQGSSERDNDENTSADVYEFHDSDDEKSTTATAQQIASKPILTPQHGTESTIKSPVSSPTLPPTLAVSDVKPCLTSPNVPLSHTRPPTPLQPISLPNPSIMTVPSPKPFTPVTPVNLEPFPSRPLASTPPATKSPPTIRNKVDDTIEHVIKMAQFDESFGTVLTPVIPSKVMSRGRSKSKDSLSEENNTVLITKVINHMNPMQSPTIVNLPQPLQAESVLPVSGGKSDKENAPITTAITTVKEESTTLETLIDPQTGILMPMLRQSDEGQYVPIVGQEQSILPKIQQPQFTIHGFQIKSESEMAAKPVIIKERPQSEERAPTLSHHPSNGVKNEGLAATMFSHQSFQQMPEPQQHQYIIPQTSTQQTHPKMVPQPKMSIVSQVSILPEPTQVYLSKPSTHYPIPNLPPGHMHKPIVCSPSHVSQDFGAAMHKNILHGHESVPSSISHLGPNPMLRVFPGQIGVTPQGLPITSASASQYQYAVISRTNEPTHALASQTRQTPISAAQQPLMQNINKFGQQPHAQPEIKSFQIPSATTITKVNTSQEESMHRKQNMMPQASIMLSSPGASSLRSVSPNVVANKAYMTHQQQQQHHAQTELFRRTAEGLIRVVSKDEHMHPGKGQDIGVSAQPPRVDINIGNIAHVSTHSPKGRILAPHEQFQSLPGRLPQYTLAESGEVRILSTQNSIGPDHPNYNQVQQPVYGHTYSSSPPILPLGSRTGVPEKMSQVLHERNRIPPNIQQQQQHPMQHLQSPHAIDQRNSDSPILYGPPRHHVYQTPSPAHQSMARENFKIVYADERQQHANSPSYPPTFDSRGTPVSVAERDRVLSPYAVNVLQPRASYSPPPAHGRYAGIPQTALEALGNERQRMQMQIQTPPHANPVPPQGDSLLMLLQRYPIMWQGLLALKNDNAACQMHFVSGNVNVARDSLPSNPDGSIPPLRIEKRMRLEQAQLEGVARKMQMEPEHCILLALPCGRDHMDVLQQSNNLRNGFITYLQLKQAAGIVNILHPSNQQPAYVIHIFPSCDFANENLARIAPDLLHGVADIAHLLIVVATV